MFKLIKKAQQDYLTEKIKGQKAYWCEFEEGILLAWTGHTLYNIPNGLLHVKLADTERTENLKNFGNETDGYRPVEYKGMTADGLAIFTAGEKEVLAQQKLAKPFLSVEDVRVKIKDEKSAIRFYAANGTFLGLVMPMRKKGMQR